MSKKPTLTAFCRTESILDLQKLLQDVVQTPIENDRRHGARIEKQVLLYVQPLNYDYQPLGEMFTALTENISQNGIGFLHEAPFPTDYIRIAVSAESSSRALAKVCYNELSKDPQKGYRVGVEFLTDSDTPNGQRSEP